MSKVKDRFSGIILSLMFLFGSADLFGMVICSSNSPGPDTCPLGTAAECTGSVAAGPYCVFALGQDLCGDCTSFGIDSVQCTDPVRTDGNCSWNGTCCVAGSAPAPELPPGAFWYFCVAATATAVVISRWKSGSSPAA